MKVDLIFSDGTKQINFTPENDDEKRALKLITPDDNISLAVQNGQFGEERFKPFSISINRCKGGYLRAYGSSDSIMLVLTPKEKEEEKVETKKVVIAVMEESGTDTSKSFPNEEAAMEYINSKDDGIERWFHQVEVSI